MTNYDSTAGVVTSLLGRMFKFKKVMDVGCTEKAWLKAFKKNGAEVFGVCMTGHHVDFNEDGIRTQDIDFGSQRFTVQEKQDLAISIDFVEKFPPELVGRYLDDLINVSDVVLFSSQLPEVLSLTSETGRERAVSYWHKMFEERGFVALDCIRPQVWDSNNVLLEYRQNMMLYVREKNLSQYPRLFDFYMKHDGTKIIDAIHPMIYKNSVNFFQDKINDLTKEVDRLNKKPKRVLYAFYHPMALSWVIIHKLKVNRYDDAYVLIPKDGMHWKTIEKWKALHDLLKKGIFKGVYTYQMLVGVNTKTFGNSVSNDGDESVDRIGYCESKIYENITHDLNSQWCDISSFDEIYSHTDAHDDLGIYLSLSKKSYFWFEGSPGTLEIKAKENVIKLDHNANPVYRDVLLKHKTLLGLNEYESVILWPESRKDSYPKEKCIIFDAGHAAQTLSDVDKNIIAEVFGMQKAPYYENMTMIMPQGTYWTYSIYDLCKLVHERYNNKMAYTLATVQCIVDYYVPAKTVPVLKPHPSLYIDEVNSKRYFNGAYSYHSLCTFFLMKILPDRYSVPQYAVLTSGSVGKQIRKDTSIINCPGIWLFSIFYNKYYVVLCALRNMNYLCLNIGDRFFGIGEMENHVPYHTKQIATDINNLIRVQWPGVSDESKYNFIILQTDEKIIYEKINIHDFVIYTDIWETLSVECLKGISSKFHVGIVKICKKPIKKIEDILVPLQDEYVFFFSKDSSYLDRLKDFSITKINKAMGIELTAEIMQMDEYVKVCQGNG